MLILGLNMFHADASAAISGTKVTMALTIGFTRSICLRCTASASRADIFFIRIRRAISTAPIKKTEESRFGGGGSGTLETGVLAKTSRHIGRFLLTGASLPRIECSSSYVGKVEVVSADISDRALSNAFLHRLVLAFPAGRIGRLVVMGFALCSKSVASTSGS